MKLRYGVFHHHTARICLERRVHGRVDDPRQRPAGKTLDYLMAAFDNAGDGFTGLYITYLDDLSLGP